MSEPGSFDRDRFVDQWWPAVVARVGERRDALMQTIADKATQRGFEPGLAGDRFANLCMAFGPGFELRPENEWALALLLDERLSPWVKLHQLVQRGAAELKRRSADGPSHAAKLTDADAALFLAHGGAARGRSLTACDIEAVEFRLLDTAWRQEYTGSAKDWTRRPVVAPTPVRFDAQHAAPRRLTVLTQDSTGTTPVRLQVRQVHHGRCGLERHPALRWIHGRGQRAWAGLEAKSVAWPLHAPQIELPPRLLHETWPEVTLLQLESCGLRDDGVPLTGAEVQVWSYPATQWQFAFERKALLGYELPDPKSAPPAVAPTRCTVEGDGQPHAADGWCQGFDAELPRQLGEGLAALLEAWRPVVRDPRLHADVSLLDGAATLTWGWREGPGGLVDEPMLRAIVELDLAASMELRLDGLLEYAGARAQVRLRVSGQAQLQRRVERLRAETKLLEAVTAATLRWRWPVTVDCDAVADDSGIVLGEIGPCTGAIVGVAGLRPSVRVGGAWEWYVTLTLEPVSTRVVVHDPLLGRTEGDVALLGSLTLLDWSVV
jgi:hypothetical protein